jgi:hypothetical protein
MGTMPLPEHLERLKEVSIDTLGLSQSTQALLKWHGITHVLDCIAFFCLLARHREVSDPWPRLFRLMFGDVREALIAAGYWELVLDTDVWRSIDEDQYDIADQRIVCWHGQDQDVYKISVRQLSLSEMPHELTRRFANIGQCINYFLILLSGNPSHWLDIGIYNDTDKPADESFSLNKYLFRVVQPRLVEMGFWSFVEEHVDDWQ